MDQPGSTTNSRNVLGGDIEITGTVKFGNELILDGKVDGEILSEGALTIGKNAKVTGEIKTGSAVVYGTVTGNITVKDRAELKSSAQVEGDLKAARVAIEEGAIFIGKSEISSRPAKS
jgi:cytoskeletal protein CcmA (bactofilin family)